MAGSRRPQHWSRLGASQRLPHDSRPRRRAEGLEHRPAAVDGRHDQAIEPGLSLAGAQEHRRLALATTARLANKAQAAELCDFRGWRRWASWQPAQIPRNIGFAVNPGHLAALRAEARAHSQRLGRVFRAIMSASLAVVRRPCRPEKRRTAWSRRIDPAKQHALCRAGQPQHIGIDWSRAPTFHPPIRGGTSHRSAQCGPQTTHPRSHGTPSRGHLRP